MHGLAIVDKPAGWTSHDVVAKMRRVLGTRRIGHAGTLDPMATGVLPLLVGRATRALDYLPGGKVYTATLRLGLETDTQDSTGHVLAQSNYRPGEQEIRAVLARFVGPQKQIPPMYSAVKVNGKRLYDLARAGVEIERAPRTVRIDELTVLSCDGDTVVFRVSCSAGTYVRTLCHDAGKMLGCGAVMTALRRTMACGYTLENAHTPESWQDDRPPLLPVDTVFAAHPAVTVSPSAAARIRNGAAVSGISAPDGPVRVYDGAGSFLMLGRAENGLLITVKSFFEV